MKCVVYFGKEKMDKLLDELVKEFKNIEIVSPRDKKTLLEKIAGAEIYFSPWIDENVLRQGKDLKWFHCASAGLDHVIDKITAVRPDIILTSNKGVADNQISEWVIAMALYELKQIRKFQDAFRKREILRTGISSFTFPFQHELEGKTACVVGLGHIGAKTAQKFHALGCRVIGIKRRVAEYPFVEKIGTLEDVPEFFPQSDIISVHLPLTPETRKCIGRKAIFSMKKGALFINTARGSIVDEEPLKEKLRKGEIRAVLDVVGDEPIKRNSSWFDIPNVLVTHHLSWYSQEFYEKMFTLFRKNLRLYLAGKEENLLNRVNLKIGY
jgi:phosphoglycerate dehydrogenase-like enzyme